MGHAYREIVYLQELLFFILRGQFLWGVMNEFLFSQLHSQFKIFSWVSIGSDE